LKTLLEQRLFQFAPEKLKLYKKRHIYFGRVLVRARFLGPRPYMEDSRRATVV